MPVNKDVFFSVEDPDFASDYFRMFEFKVKRCPRAKPHDWTLCPFSHPGEKAKRRDPKRYRYSGTACPEFRKNACCRRGDACPFAHGVFECWLHPSRYRTQLCTDGTACKRRVCFFAHLEEELRKSEDDPLMFKSGEQMSLLGNMDMDKLHAMSNLLNLNDQSTVPSGLSDAPLLDMNSELLKSLTSGQSSPLPQLNIGGASTPVNNNVNAANPSSIQTQIKMLQIQQQILELQELEKQQQESQNRQQKLLQEVMMSLGTGNQGEGGDLMQSAGLQQQSEAEQLLGMMNTLQLQEQEKGRAVGTQLLPSMPPMPASPTVQRSDHSYSSQGSAFVMQSSTPLSGQGVTPLTSSPSLSPVPSSSQLLNLPPLSGAELPALSAQPTGDAQVDELVALLATQVNQQEDVGKLIDLLKATGQVDPVILAKLQAAVVPEVSTPAMSIPFPLTQRYGSQPDITLSSSPGVMAFSSSPGIMSSSLSTPLPMPSAESPVASASMEENADAFKLGDEKLQQALAAAVQKTQHNRNSSLDQILNELPRSVSDLRMADGNVHGIIAATVSSPQNS
eukprot:TRINITY_DN3994_c0_g1_i1.p1 TRINITY_DN3994_c0_g1~~TRINITY_DN3994_c0_g1_i1.p1  ORF type:complete len:563 (-),score=69.52 TRINITY_DN3994_c0_g1_i1:1394-3082(-)